MMKITDKEEFDKRAVFLANVAFEPGCRNNWYIRHAKSGGGQLAFLYRGRSSR